VAIERNLEILPRPSGPKTAVLAGDRYEIVQFVGGAKTSFFGIQISFQQVTHLAFFCLEVGARNF